MVYWNGGGSDRWPRSILVSDGSSTRGTVSIMRISPCRNLGAGHVGSSPSGRMMPDCDDGRLGSRDSGPTHAITGATSIDFQRGEDEAVMKLELALDKKGL